MNTVAWRQGRWALVTALVVLLYAAFSADAHPSRRLQAAKPPPSAPLPVAQFLPVKTFYRLWKNTTTVASNTTFLDVRPKALWELSHVPGARNVPAEAARQLASLWSNRKRRVDPTKNIACYSTVVGTATTACNEFIKVRAYAKVQFYVMEDGFASWVTADYPVETAN